ncbi:hypothetical protein CXF86_01805 [Shewanella sp. GutCb]|uniref:hypothetical protein n=1 Tax=Shewanella sp. GutCb TaxID=2058315 RepID=UPI000C7C8ED7|nr:hypothetical protein [Shewanella sp. GutCb]PKG76240.1 hypothetical protein CXF86_01805 [Shewanella sp. GutCb]
MDSGITIPDAIFKLFSIQVAKDSQFLKNKANSLVRNGLIKTVQDKHVQRSTIYLKDKSQLTVLHNALIINAIYLDPKEVKRIFEDTAYRAECAETVNTLLSDMTSLMGIALQSPMVLELVNALRSGESLYHTKLPNPFSKLPQVALGSNTGLLQALLVQSSVLKTSDTVLMAYLQKDWKKASELCSHLDESVLGIKELKQSIDSQLQEACDFDDLLDQMRNF